MFVVYDSFKQICKKKFVFGNPFQTPGYEVYNLFVEDEEKEEEEQKSSSSAFHKKCYLISQKTKLVWDKTYSHDEQCFSLELCNFENNFINNFKKLYTRILNSFKKNHVIYADAEVKYDCFKQYGNDASSLRFFNVRPCDVLIYDENHQTISSKQLKKNDIVKVLIEFNNCWVKEQMLGLEIRVVQIMRLFPNRIVNNSFQIKSSIPLQSYQTTSHCPSPPPPPLPPPRPPPPYSPLPAPRTSLVLNNAPSPRASKPKETMGKISVSIEELVQAKNKLKKWELNV
jgi:hypothetical protein